MHRPGRTGVPSLIALVLVHMLIGPLSGGAHAADGDLAGVRAPIPVQRTESCDIDGVLAEPTWQKGSWVTGFRVFDAPEKLAAQQTRIAFRHDGSLLYVAVVAEEPEPAKIQAADVKRDGRVYSGDSIELMFDPNPDVDAYHHLAINARGCLYDSQVMSSGGLSVPSWNGKLALATSTGKDSWTLELAIPFSEMACNPDSPTAWRANVTRSRLTDTRTLSSFVPLRGSFHKPELFVPLAFEDLDLRPYLWRIRPPFDQRTIRRDNTLMHSSTVHVTNMTGAFRFISLTGRFLPGPSGAAPVTVNGGLDAGQGLAFTLPDVPVTNADGRLEIELRDRLAPDTILAQRSYPVKVAFTPIRIDVTRPFYRNCIYATESLDEIVADIAIALTEAQMRGSVLETALVRSSNGHTIAKRSDAAKATVRISLPVPELDDGEYQLRTVLRSETPGRGKPIASASTVIRKLPPAAHEWRIREDQVVLYNGEPFVPFGFFSVPPNAFGQMHRAGHTAVQWYSAQYKRTRESLFERLDQVQAAGLKIMFYPYPHDSYWLSSFKRIYEPMTPQEEDALRARVRDIKDHPAILGYYLFDEPYCQSVLPARAESCYNVCRTEDPYHPCIILCQSANAMFTYREACDIHMPDPYPGFVYRGLAARDMRVVKTYVETALRASRGRQAVWFTPQSFHWRRPNQRAPMFRELRNMVWLGLGTGATGAVAYKAERWNPDIRLGMDFLAGEVRDLNAAVLAKNLPDAVRVDAPDREHMHVSVRRSNEDLFVLACSTSTKPQSVRFSLPGASDVHRLHIVSEARSVDASDGWFTDEFDTYGVHLYTTNERLANRETVARTQAEINRIRAPKPGNLLHESRGTVVTSSDDGRGLHEAVDSVLTPNGVGWVSAATSKLPRDLTLTLAAPQSVARIVAYSLGVTACQLQARQGDDWITVATLAPTDAQPCEARFSPVLTSAIRLRVLETAKVKEFRIYEVEAYGP